MKTTLCTRAFALPVALAVLMFAGLGWPTDALATERTIEEFVEAQGTLDLGFLFVPPVPNFIGFSDPVSGLSMSVDYAGLANETCDNIAGTTFAGTVEEKEVLSNGSVVVEVELSTFNAITWVIEGGDFGAGPVVFGERWAEDENGDCVLEDPALGSSTMELRFINTAPGAPLPDLIQLVAFPETHQRILSIEVSAQAVGELPDGTPAIAETHQKASATGKSKNLVFTEETVTVVPLEE